VAEEEVEAGVVEALELSAMKRGAERAAEGGAGDEWGDRPGEVRGSDRPGPGRSYARRAAC
jgi:hypothetical protein